MLASFSITCCCTMSRCSSFARHLCRLHGSMNEKCAAWISALNELRGISGSEATPNK